MRLYEWCAVYFETRPRWHFRTPFGALCLLCCFRVLSIFVRRRCDRVHAVFARSSLFICLARRKPVMMTHGWRWRWKHRESNCRVCIARRCLSHAHRIDGACASANSRVRKFRFRNLCHWTNPFGTRTHSSHHGVLFLFCDASARKH